MLATRISVVAPLAELRLVRALVTYDAPEGTVHPRYPARPLPAAKERRRGWMQLVIEGSDTMWVRRDELEAVRIRVPRSSGRV